MELNCLVESKCQLGEGPVWDATRQRLLWVDIFEHCIHSCDENGGRHRIWKLKGMVGFIVPVRDSIWLAGVESSLEFIELQCDGSVNYLKSIPVEPDLPDNRINDGICDAEGNLWFGTMNMSGAEASGSLYCLDASHRLRRMNGGYTVSNGPVFSCDGKTLYHNETFGSSERARGVYAFDLEAGEVQRERLLIDYRELSGMPDGMLVDVEDRIWVCEWDGGRVAVYDRKGVEVKEVCLPVRNVTKAAFGGCDLDTLFLTTARTGLSDETLESEPLAGGLFAIRGLARGELCSTFNAQVSL